MQQVLDASQTTGSEFTHPGTVAFLILADHIGGTWQLQVKAPNGTWVDDEMTFIDDGIQIWYGTPSLPYRLTSGSVGASAWLLTNAYKAGVLQ